jgi:hypothetical protein
VGIDIGGHVKMSDASAATTQSPNEQLAAIIVKALDDKGLLPREYRDSAIKKIESGKASASDWRIWAEELVMEKETEDGDSTKD